jgi:hypothetical protein
MIDSKGSGNYEEPPCSVCSDDGLYFCRICSTHFCAEHTCSHLSVAWESNSWTRRNADETGILRRTSKVQTDAEDVSADNTIQTQGLLSFDEQTLRAHSTQFLREQYNLYLDTARAIRNELERREVFATGKPSVLAGLAFEHERGANILRRQKRSNPVQVRSGRVSKSASASIEILSRALRANCISVEQIAAIFAANNVKSKEM